MPAIGQLIIKSVGVGVTHVSTSFLLIRTLKTFGSYLAVGGPHFQNPRFLGTIMRPPAPRSARAYFGTMSLKSVPGPHPLPGPSIGDSKYCVVVMDSILSAAFKITSNAWVFNLSSRSEHRGFSALVTLGRAVMVCIVRDRVQQVVSRSALFRKGVSVVLLELRKDRSKDVGAPRSIAVLSFIVLSPSGTTDPR